MAGTWRFRRYGVPRPDRRGAHRYPAYTVKTAHQGQDQQGCHGDRPELLYLLHGVAFRWIDQVRR